jgi:hypothetical protein
MFNWIVTFIRNTTTTVKILDKGKNIYILFEKLQQPVLQTYWLIEIEASFLLGHQLLV